jgi:hypothetical protein
LEKENHQQKYGYAKIKGCCQQAASNGFDWAWVDTCCTDKSSSAELSEAINSMIQWYQASQRVTHTWKMCHPEKILLKAAPHFEPAIASHVAGRCYSLRYSLLRAVTGIEEKVLGNPRMSLPRLLAACKFSWAAQRKTTRVEDTAYCLLGLLGVNMPLLYGEGEKAFIWLQEAVIGSSSDISLLAWGFRLPWEVIAELESDSVFANSPIAFSEWPQ